MLSTEELETIHAASIVEKHLAETALKERKENETLRQMNADASRLASQEATAKHYAEEHLTHLAKFIGLHGMTWAHVVSETVSLIERQKTEADRLRQARDAARGATLATLPDAEVIAIDELMASRRKLRAAIDKSVEALGNAMPECRGMSIHELVIEAVGRIRQLTSDRDALQARVNRAEERANASGLERISLTGELAVAHAERVRLCSMLDQCQASNRNLHAQLEESRAENGRQAATIAAMRGAVVSLRGQLEIQGEHGNWNHDPYMHGMFNGMELALSGMEDRSPEFRKSPDQWLDPKMPVKPAKCPPPVRIETPHTGKDDKMLFRIWMDSEQKDVLKLEPAKADPAPPQP